MPLPPSDPCFPVSTKIPLCSQISTEEEEEEEERRRRNKFT
jgi:hypothetical protein